MLIAKKSYGRLKMSLDRNQAYKSINEDRKLRRCSSDKSDGLLVVMLGLFNHFPHSLVYLACGFCYVLGGSD